IGEARARALGGLVELTRRLAPHGQELQVLVDGRTVAIVAGPPAGFLRGCRTAKRHASLGFEQDGASYALLVLRPQARRRPVRTCRRQWLGGRTSHAKGGSQDRRKNRLRHRGAEST